MGFIQLDFPWANQLTEELINLPFKGYGVQGAVNRTETEFLSNINELESVQRLIHDKNIFNLVWNQVKTSILIYFPIKHNKHNN